MKNEDRQSRESVSGPAGVGDRTTAETGTFDPERTPRPYRPPEVRKRRSLRQATLISGGDQDHGATGTM
jgi:hypothetical protein